MQSRPELLSHLFAALERKDGVVILTNDPPRLRTELEKLRRADAQFLPLEIRLSPMNPTAELWIIKKEVPDGKG